MNGHTPGPWGFEVSKYGSGSQTRIFSLAIRRGVASRTDDPAQKLPDAVIRLEGANANTQDARDRREADARLIAAAPEMLAALQGLCAAHHRQDWDPSEEEWDMLFDFALRAIAKAGGR